jgi:DHA3 family tetracycline resistance protein-like MFS transporter
VSFRRRLAGARILQPLRRRDFALLTGGSAVSLIGDGFFHVALAWQVYQISNVPTAMSFVGVAATLPLVIFILIGGTFSDRYDRRRLMIGADLLRGLAIGAMGILSIAGVLELWHMAVMLALVGLGDAFFNPAATAIVPDLLPEDKLPQANAISGVLRRLMVSIIGPALAGFMIALFGPGQAFVIDALTFVVSAVAVYAIKTRPQVRPKADLGVRQTLHDIGEGMAYVRGRPWIWATLLSAMFSLLVFIGPVQVLVPYLVKNRLGLGPEALGTIFAVGGVGSILMAVAIGQLGLPRRRVTAMYVSWTLGIGVMAIYGVMDSLWQALLVAAFSHSMFELGQVIWTTMLQQLVPRNLLGRVSSVDWLVSIGLVPLSYALTGPASDLLGPGSTMVYGALAGAVITILLILVPGVRDPEKVTPPAPKETGLVISTSPEQDAL